MRGKQAGMDIKKKKEKKPSGKNISSVFGTYVERPFDKLIKSSVMIVPTAAMMTLSVIAEISIPMAT